MNRIFEGVATALYTPFCNGKIDYGQFESLLDRQLKAKIDALVFLGTTGESPTVTREERREIIRFAVQRLKSRVPIIVGTGSNCTETACELTLEAKELGADCALIVTPYYNRCEQDGLILHYKEISGRCKFPYVVYNVPSRTGVNVEPHTAKIILSDGYAFGLKEASTDEKHLEKLFSILENKYAIYCGSDENISLFLKNGSLGAISVASNVIPLKIKEFIGNFKSNYEKHNYEYNCFFKDFFKLLTTKINPIPIKCVDQILHGTRCEFRLPLNLPNSDYFEYLKKELDKLLYTRRNHA